MLLDTTISEACWPSSQFGRRAVGQPVNEQSTPWPMSSGVVGLKLKIFFAKFGPVLFDLFRDGSPD